MRFFHIGLLVLSFYSCDSQEQSYKKNGVRQENQQEKDNNSSANDKVITEEVNVYGRWKCVAMDTRGYQKFSLAEAKQLEKSILNIEPHFAQVCSDGLYAAAYLCGLQGAISHNKKSPGTRAAQKLNGIFELIFILSLKTYLD